ncbi:NAD(P)-binding protein [Serendipita vermifera]|nr:NAD(P)-binding protein [Serendipita vermifera]
MAAAFIEIFGETLYYKYVGSLPETNKDLTGRTVIVTGSNGGIGLEATKLFYRMNPARLILAVRSTSKGQEAKTTIETERKETTKTSVEVWELDMGLFESVKRFAKRCHDELERVDIFLENAGVGRGPWSVTKDGWETCLQVNVISTYMLAALMAPLLQKTSKLPDSNPATPLKPHLVIVASDVHPFARFPERNTSNILAALNDQANFSMVDRYNLTKLLNVILTRRLASSTFWSSGDYSKDDIVVCCVNPGLCRTDLLRRISNIGRVIVYTLFGRPASEGAKNHVWACLTDEIPTGSYISQCRVAKTFGMANTLEGEQAEKRVWNEIADLVTKMAPETTSVWDV